MRRPVQSSATGAGTTSCAMCGQPLPEGPHAGCASCPLGAGCAIVCCPACGYSDIGTDSSSLVRLARRLRRRRGGLPGTLAGVPAGAAAEVTHLDGLTASRREQLVAYGVAPGREIEVLQVAPVTVLRVDHVELALERSVAAGIGVAVVEGGVA